MQRQVHVQLTQQQAEDDSICIDAMGIWQHEAHQHQLQFGYTDESGEVDAVIVWDDTLTTFDVHENSPHKRLMLTLVQDAQAEGYLQMAQGMFVFRTSLESVIPLLTEDTHYEIKVIYGMQQEHEPCLTQVLHLKMTVVD